MARLARLLAAPASVASVAAAAVQQVAPAQPQPVSVCPLEAPDGGYTSFVAWTAIFNAQPHHVAAPFKQELVPPIMMPELCIPSQWRSDAWAYSGMRGSDWMAAPKNAGAFQLTVGDDSCSQQLSALSVFTVIQSHAALRLHFEGCGRPASVVALRLTNDTRPSTGTGEPTVMGIDLLSWMCSVSPTECKAAKDQVHNSGSAATPTGVQMAKGKVGMGKCTGIGVQSHELSPPPASAAGCAAECQQRITQNLADPAQGSCRGYAWSERLRSCIVYDGWPVTGTEEAFASDGYFCSNMTAQTTAPEALPAAEAAPSAAELDLSKVFADPRAVTARRMGVSPFVKGCFPTFNWYIIDRWVNVPPSDFDVILQMTKTNVTNDKYLFSHPSHGGHAPRSNLVIQRTCIRDCAGALRAECTAAGEGVPAPPGFALSPDGRLVAVAQRAAQPAASAANFTTVLAGVMGEPAAQTFTDARLFPQLAVSAFLAAALGAGAALGLGVFWSKYIASRPKYHQVEEVKLIYEGDEEETVALRSAGDGGGSMNMMSSVAGGNGLSATWVPTKAKDKEGGLARLMGTWG